METILEIASVITALATCLIVLEKLVSIITMRIPSVLDRMHAWSTRQPRDRYLRKSHRRNNRDMLRHQIRVSRQELRGYVKGVVRHYTGQALMRHHVQVHNKNKGGDADARD